MSLEFRKIHLGFRYWFRTHWPRDSVLAVPKRCYNKTAQTVQFRIKGNASSLCWRLQAQDQGIIRSASAESPVSSLSAVSSHCSPAWEKAEECSASTTQSSSTDPSQMPCRLWDTEAFIYSRWSASYRCGWSISRAVVLQLKLQDCLNGL